MSLKPGRKYVIKTIQDRIVKKDQSNKGAVEPTQEQDQYYYPRIDYVQNATESESNANYPISQFNTEFFASENDSIPLKYSHDTIPFFGANRVTYNDPKYEEVYEGVDSDELYQINSSAQISYGGSTYNHGEIFHVKQTSDAGYLGDSFTVTKGKPLLLEVVFTIAATTAEAQPDFYFVYGTSSTAYEKGIEYGGEKYYPGDMFQAGAGTGGNSYKYWNGSSYAEYTSATSYIPDAVVIGLSMINNPSDKTKWGGNFQDRMDSDSTTLQPERSYLVYGHTNAFYNGHYLRPEVLLRNVFKTGADTSFSWDSATTNRNFPVIREIVKSDSIEAGTDYYIASDRQLNNSTESQIKYDGNYIKTSTSGVEFSGRKSITNYSVPEKQLDLTDSGKDVESIKLDATTNGPYDVNIERYTGNPFVIRKETLGLRKNQEYIVVPKKVSSLSVGVLYYVEGVGSVESGGVTYEAGETFKATSAVFEVTGIASVYNVINTVTLAGAPAGTQIKIDGATAVSYTSTLLSTSYYTRGLRFEVSACSYPLLYWDQSVGSAEVYPIVSSLNNSSPIHVQTNGDGSVFYPSRNLYYLCEGIGLDPFDYGKKTKAEIDAGGAEITSCTDAGGIWDPQTSSHEKVAKMYFNNGSFEATGGECSNSLYSRNETACKEHGETWQADVSADVFDDSLFVYKTDKNYPLPVTTSASADVGAGSLSVGALGSDLATNDCVVFDGAVFVLSAPASSGNTSISGRLLGAGVGSGVTGLVGIKPDTQSTPTNPFEKYYIEDLEITYTSTSGSGINVSSLPVDVPAGALLKFKNAGVCVAEFKISANASKGATELQGSLRELTSITASDTAKLPTSEVGSLAINKQYRNEQRFYGVPDFNTIRAYNYKDIATSHNSYQNIAIYEVCGASDELTNGEKFKVGGSGYIKYNNVMYHSEGSGRVIIDHDKNAGGELDKADSDELFNKGAYYQPGEELVVGTLPLPSHIPSGHELVFPNAVFKLTKNADRGDVEITGEVIVDYIEDYVASTVWHGDESYYYKIERSEITGAGGAYSKVDKDGAALTGDGVFVYKTQEPQDPINLDNGPYGDMRLTWEDGEKIDASTQRKVINITGSDKKEYYTRVKPVEASSGSLEENRSYQVKADGSVVEVVYEDTGEGYAAGTGVSMTVKSLPHDLASGTELVFYPSHPYRSFKAETEEQRHHKHKEDFPVDHWSESRNARRFILTSGASAGDTTITGTLLASYPSNVDTFSGIGNKAKAEIFREISYNGSIYTAGQYFTCRKDVKTLTNGTPQVVQTWSNSENSALDILNSTKAEKVISYDDFVDYVGTQELYSGKTFNFESKSSSFRFSETSDTDTTLTLGDVTGSQSRFSEVSDDYYFFNPLFGAIKTNTSLNIYKVEKIHERAYSNLFNNTATTSYESSNGSFKVGGKGSGYVTYSSTTKNIEETFTISSGTVTFNPSSPVTYQKINTGFQANKFYLVGAEDLTEAEESTNDAPDTLYQKLKYNGNRYFPFLRDRIPQFDTVNYTLTQGSLQLHAPYLQSYIFGRSFATFVENRLRGGVLDKIKIEKLSDTGYAVDSTIINTGRFFSLINSTFMYYTILINKKYNNQWSGWEISERTAVAGPEKITGLINNTPSKIRLFDTSDISSEIQDIKYKIATSSESYYTANYPHLLNVVEEKQPVIVNSLEDERMYVVQSGSIIYAKYNDGFDTTDCDNVSGVYAANKFFYGKTDAWDENGYKLTTMSHDGTRDATDIAEAYGFGNFDEYFVSPTDATGSQYLVGTCYDPWEILSNRVYTVTGSADDKIEYNGRIYCNGESITGKSPNSPNTMASDPVARTLMPVAEYVDRQQSSPQPWMYSNEGVYSKELGYKKLTPLLYKEQTGSSVTLETNKRYVLYNSPATTTIAIGSNTYNATNEMVPRSEFIGRDTPNTYTGTATVMQKFEDGQTLLPGVEYFVYGQGQVTYIESITTTASASKGSSVAVSVSSVPSSIQVGQIFEFDNGAELIVASWGVGSITGAVKNVDIASGASAPVVVNVFGADVVTTTGELGVSSNGLYDPGKGNLAVSSLPQDLFEGETLVFSGGGVFILSENAYAGDNFLRGDVVSGHVGEAETAALIDYKELKTKTITASGNFSTSGASNTFKGLKGFSRVGGKLGSVEILTAASSGSIRENFLYRVLGSGSVTYNGIAHQGENIIYGDGSTGVNVSTISSLREVVDPAGVEAGDTVYAYGAPTVNLFEYSHNGTPAYLQHGGSRTWDDSTDSGLKIYKPPFSTTNDFNPNEPTIISSRVYGIEPGVTYVVRSTDIVGASSERRAVVKYVKDIGSCVTKSGVAISNSKYHNKTDCTRRDVLVIDFGGPDYDTDGGASSAIDQHTEEEKKDSGNYKTTGIKFRVTADFPAHYTDNIILKANDVLEFSKGGKFILSQNIDLDDLTSVQESGETRYYGTMYGVVPFGHSLYHLEYCPVLDWKSEFKDYYYTSDGSLVTQNNGAERVYVGEGEIVNTSGEEEYRVEAGVEIVYNGVVKTLGDTFAGVPSVDDPLVPVDSWSPSAKSNGFEYVTRVGKTETEFVGVAGQPFVEIIEGNPKIFVKGEDLMEDGDYIVEGDSVTYGEEYTTDGTKITDSYYRDYCIVDEDDNVTLPSLSQESTTFNDYADGLFKATSDSYFKINSSDSDELHKNSSWLYHTEKSYGYNASQDLPYRSEANPSTGLAEAQDFIDSTDSSDTFSIANGDNSYLVAPGYLTFSLNKDTINFPEVLDSSLSYKETQESVLFDLSDTDGIYQMSQNSTYLKAAVFGAGDFALHNYDYNSQFLFETTRYKAYGNLNTSADAIEGKEVSSLESEYMYKVKSDSIKYSDRILEIDNELGYCSVDNYGNQIVFHHDKYTGNIVDGVINVMSNANARQDALLNYASDRIKVKRLGKDSENILATDLLIFDSKIEYTGTKDHEVGFDSGLNLENTSLTEGIQVAPLPVNIMEGEILFFYSPAEEKVENIEKAKFHCVRTGEFTLDSRKYGPNGVSMFFEAGDFGDEGTLSAGGHDIVPVAILKTTRASDAGSTALFGEVSQNAIKAGYKCVRHVALKFDDLGDVMSSAPLQEDWDDGPGSGTDVFFGPNATEFSGRLADPLYYVAETSYPISDELVRRTLTNGQKLSRIINHDNQTKYRNITGGQEAKFNASAKVYSEYAANSRFKAVEGESSWKGTGVVTYSNIINYSTDFFWRGKTADTEMEYNLSGEYLAGQPKVLFLLDKSRDEDGVLNNNSTIDDAATNFPVRYNLYDFNYDSSTRASLTIGSNTITGKNNFFVGDGNSHTITINNLSVKTTQNQNIPSSVVVGKVVNTNEIKPGKEYFVWGMGSITYQGVEIYGYSGPDVDSLKQEDCPYKFVGASSGNSIANFQENPFIRKSWNRSEPVPPATVENIPNSNIPRDKAQFYVGKPMVLEVFDISHATEAGAVYYVFGEGSIKYQEKDIYATNKYIAVATNFDGGTEADKKIIPSGAISHAGKMIASLGDQYDLREDFSFSPVLPVTTWTYAGLFQSLGTKTPTLSTESGKRVYVYRRVHGSEALDTSGGGADYYVFGRGDSIFYGTGNTRHKPRGQGGNKATVSGKFTVGSAAGNKKPVRFLVSGKSAISKRGLSCCVRTKRTNGAINRHPRLAYKDIFIKPDDYPDQAEEDQNSASDKKIPLSNYVVRGSGEIIYPVFMFDSEPVSSVMSQYTLVSGNTENFTTGNVYRHKIYSRNYLAGDLFFAIEMPVAIGVVNTDGADAKRYWKVTGRERVYRVSDDFNQTFKDNSMDQFLDIAPAKDGIESGQIQEGVWYEVVYKDSEGDILSNDSFDLLADSETLKNNMAVIYEDHRTKGSVFSSYRVGEKFMGRAIADSSADGGARVVREFNAHKNLVVRPVEGIRKFAPFGGWSNEWSMFITSTHHHPSRTSTWHHDYYGDVMGFLNQRCHIYSEDFKLRKYSHLLETFGYGIKPVVRSEAPPGHMYLEGSNANQDWFYSDGTQEDLNKWFYSSCQIYKPDYYVESAKVFDADAVDHDGNKMFWNGRCEGCATEENNCSKLNKKECEEAGGTWIKAVDQVTITLNRRLDHTPSTAFKLKDAKIGDMKQKNMLSLWHAMGAGPYTAEVYRTDENAIVDYLLREKYDTKQLRTRNIEGEALSFETPDGNIITNEKVQLQCHKGRIGDAAPDIGLWQLPDDPFGACEPRFYFTKHVPYVHDDNRGEATKHLKTPITIDPFTQMEQYLRGFCGGFIDKKSDPREDDITEVDVPKFDANGNETFTKQSLDPTCYKSKDYDYLFENLSVQALEGEGKTLFKDYDKVEITKTRRVRVRRTFSLPSPLTGVSGYQIRESKAYSYFVERLVSNNEYTKVGIVPLRLVKVGNKWKFSFQRTFVDEYDITVEGSENVPYEASYRVTFADKAGNRLVSQGLPAYNVATGQANMLVVKDSQSRATVTFTPSFCNHPEYKTEQDCLGAAPPLLPGVWSPVKSFVVERKTAVLPHITDFIVSDIEIDVDEEQILQNKLNRKVNSVDKVESGKFRKYDINLKREEDSDPLYAGITKEYDIYYFAYYKGLPQGKCLDSDGDEITPKVYGRKACLESGGAKYQPTTITLEGNKDDFEKLEKIDAYFRGVEMEDGSKKSGRLMFKADVRSRGEDGVFSLEFRNLSRSAVAPVDPTTGKEIPVLRYDRGPLKGRKRLFYGIKYKVKIGYQRGMDNNDSNTRRSPWEQVKTYRNLESGKSISFVDDRIYANVNVNYRVMKVQTTNATSRWLSPLMLEDRLTKHPDSRKGFGPLPNVKMYAHLFNQTANAINLLNEARLDLPITVRYRYHTRNVAEPSSVSPQEDVSSYGYDLNVPAPTMGTYSTRGHTCHAVDFKISGGANGRYEEMVPNLGAQNLDTTGEDKLFGIKKGKGGPYVIYSSCRGADRTMTSEWYIEAGHTWFCADKEYGFRRYPLLLSFDDAYIAKGGSQTDVEINIKGEQLAFKYAVPNILKSRANPDDLVLSGRIDEDEIWHPTMTNFSLGHWPSRDKYPGQPEKWPTFCGYGDATGFPAREYSAYGFHWMENYAGGNAWVQFDRKEKVRSYCQDITGTFMLRAPELRTSKAGIIVSHQKTGSEHYNVCTFGGSQSSQCFTTRASSGDNNMRMKIPLRDKMGPRTVRSLKLLAHLASLTPSQKEIAKGYYDILKREAEETAANTPVSGGDGSSENTMSTQVTGPDGSVVDVPEDVVNLTHIYDSEDAAVGPLERIEGRNAEGKLIFCTGNNCPALDV